MENNICKNIFDGKVIVFTGTMRESISKMREIAVNYGAKTPKAVSTRTNLVVVGKNPGKKLTKARELRIDVISEDEFWEKLSL
ncbi:BRCT domain-containing protein [Clostridium sardiniense]|uniref:BRCT domain-containing protein n=1 Tax=Clostridium sardiniense TaxID=29369 RepID=UPI00195A792B|nr:BRCT domain-containing protein [Clostridium sardiniense]MBM7835502.1 NAD-dependent DNA ligase [Clostridium sardiniense]